MRICDAVDFAVISGWESTAIENHAGLVDNLRNFKSDPDLIAGSLRLVRAVAKQHRLCYAVGEAAVFDLYLLNDTNKPVTGRLRFSMVEPGGRLVRLGAWDAPAFVPDQFSYMVQAAFTTPLLTKEGIYKFRFTCDADAKGSFSREIWVANAKPQFARNISVGLSRVLPAVRNQLGALPGVEVAEFSAGGHYDLIVASGVMKGSKLDRAIGDETGLEVQPSKPAAPEEQQVAGDIPEDVFAAVKSGTPLLAIVPDDYLAHGVAKQLAALGAFTYSGQVGDTRAPWMGNWLFVREHPTFARPAGGPRDERPLPGARQDLERPADRAGAGSRRSGGDRRLQPRSRPPCRGCQLPLQAWWRAGAGASRAGVQCVAAAALARQQHCAPDRREAGVGRVRLAARPGMTEN